MHATHYNLDYLQQVFQGNDAMVLRILDVFEEEVPKYFAEMERLGRLGQWRDLHPLAHKAKSSIGMLGMKELLEEVLRIETLSRSGGDDHALGQAVSRAGWLLDTVLGALKADRGRQAESAGAQSAWGHTPTAQGGYGKLHRA